MTEEKKEFWTSASKDGLIFGLALVFTIIAGVAFRLELDHPNVSSLLSTMAIGLSVYYFSRKRSLAMGDAGFSFAQSMGYILAIALFAGFIYGAALFVSWNYLAVDYFGEVMQKSIDILTQSELPQETMNLTQEFTKSPIIMILASIFNILAYSCFIGIICSVFTKRHPKLNDEQANE